MDPLNQPERPVVADPDDTMAAGRHRIGPHVIDSAQTVMTALILAFVFRSFFIEAFIIPTGSMADALVGRHAACVCPNCGWEFDYGPDLRADRGSEQFEAPKNTRCPNCHTISTVDSERVIPKSGDRILVHKWPFVLGGPFGPRRWDVIVFRDPSNPEQNYIKRLAALPGESIEILDGDVFIKRPGETEFQIARKTDTAQRSLWFIVFDQSYLPTDLDPPGTSPAWVATNQEGSTPGGWTGLDTRVIRFSAADDLPHTLRFDPLRSRHYLRDECGYNQFDPTNYVGDVRLLAEVSFESQTGSLTFEIIRDQRRFSARIDADGNVKLLADANSGAAIEPWGEVRIAPFTQRRPRVIEFGHLDYRVYVKVDGRDVLASSDSQYAPDLDVLRSSRRVSPVEARITAAGGALEMRRLRIDRDVHYSYDRNKTLRAYADHPLKLDPGEYFVLGDNSPGSHDGREWRRVGPHLQAALDSGDYQLGTVPENQIVGRAFFVYLPGLLPIDERGKWRVPDIGRMRFIR